LQALDSQQAGVSAWPLAGWLASQQISKSHNNPAFAGWLCKAFA